ncbi:MmcQ/YjbR family DNA-binding protein [Terrabacter sp. 2YAF2]|uniref:MmcQ/YjbR family DNA-binding protein n=1 Tax=Terrabacter sp. 2YAF2 TaxID=3233026 RepID=UPI003F9A4D16
MARSRRARLRDLDEAALSLPEVTRDPPTGGRSSFQVHGKTFAFSRGPRKDAVDPATGELYDDVLAFSCTAEDKESMVSDPESPWFTTPHWNGYNAVLLLERDLGRLTVAELREVVTDAWLAKAPKRLARTFLEADGAPSPQ